MKKRLILFGTCIVVIAGTFFVVNKDKQVVKVEDKITEQAKKELTLTEDTREPLEITANQQAVISNEDGDTPSEKRGAVKTEYSATEEEVAEAAKAGEHKQKSFDVTIQKGVTIAEKDIANARDTLKKAGLNDEYYSDYDMAMVIKAASDSSLDIITVIENDDWNEIQ